MKNYNKEMEISPEMGVEGLELEEIVRIGARMLIQKAVEIEINTFLINDFSLDLKTKVFQDKIMSFPVGKQKFGRMLMIVFIVLTVIPTLLTILELSVASNTDYSQFTNESPEQTIILDRLLVLIGVIVAIIMIPRSFTKPIYSLLNEMHHVRDGDYSSQAPIITMDEIGELTDGFNEMVKGLQDREFIRDTFGKYVTEDVATVILNKNIDLEGEVRVATILVTDIANYTTISESLTPKEIVAMLNEYFSVLVGIIQTYKGVVNKFIGDSIFAMFNVPLDNAQHVENAINAALEIEAVTASRDFSGHRLTTRVGVNTGVVVAGNIGSTDRLEYTVIGDEVNVAARLEQLNKKFDTHVLIGENSYEAVKDRFNFTPLASVQLKGKEKAIKVYKIDG